MLSVVFETHSTSLDNELQLASGRYDSELSPAGEKQARELGDRYQVRDLATVFCSDLKRSYRTAEIAFAGRRIRVVRDQRLRECDYGELTRRSPAIIAELRAGCVDTPFPAGESYRQVAARVKDFLQETCRAYRGKTILVIGHRATQVALEHWTLGLSLNEAVRAPWEWQPGWRYSSNARHRGDDAGAGPQRSHFEPAHCRAAESRHRTTLATIPNKRGISMPELAEKTCIPCRGGVPPLTADEIKPLAQQLPSWDVVDGHHLDRTYKFKNFRDALDFTNKVGELAEEQGHHPDIYLSWGKVGIRLWTHKIDGLTESDFIMAAKIESLNERA